MKDKYQETGIKVNKQRETSNSNTNEKNLVSGMLMVKKLIQQFNRPFHA